MTPEEREEQSRHAASQKARTEARRQTPDQREADKMKAMIEEMVDRKVDARMAKIQFQAGQNMTISGGNGTWTFTANPPAAAQPQGGANGGTWTPIDLCGGVTAEALLRNIVTPP